MKKEMDYSMIEFVRETGYGDFPDLTGVKKILIIHLRRIGDVILSEPVVRVLYEHLHPVQIDLLVNEGTETLLENHPNINNLHVIKRVRFSNGLKERISEEIRVFKLLKKGEYDLVIALNPGDRTERCARFSNASIRVGMAGKKGGKGYTHKVSIASTGRHYVDRHLDVLRRIGLFPKHDVMLPVIKLFKHADLRIRRLLFRNGVDDSTRYLVVHPTSRWMFKCLSPKDMALIINGLHEDTNLPVVLSSGPDSIEKKYIEKVKIFINHEVIDFSAILSLTDLAELIRGAHLLLTVDTASLHIAEAVETPVVAFFGPTNEIDWGPRSNRSLVIKENSYICRPCNRDGCGGGKVSDCLQGLSPVNVVNQIRAFLE